MRMMICSSEEEVKEGGQRVTAPLHGSSVWLQCVGVETSMLFLCVCVCDLQICSRVSIRNSVFVFRENNSLTWIKFCRLHIITCTKNGFGNNLDLDVCKVKY